MDTHYVHYFTERLFKGDGMIAGWYSKGAFLAAFCSPLTPLILLGPPW